MQHYYLCLINEGEIINATWILPENKEMRLGG